MLDLPPPGESDDFYETGKPQLSQMFKPETPIHAVGTTSTILAPQWDSKTTPSGYAGEGFYHHQLSTPSGFGGYFALYFAGWVQMDNFQNQSVGFSFDLGLNLKLQGNGNSSSTVPLALGGIIVEDNGVNKVEFRATYANEAPVVLSTLTLGLTPEDSQLLVGKFLFGKDGNKQGTHSFEAALNPFSSDEILGIDGVEWAMVKDGLTNKSYNIENMFVQSNGGGSVTFDDLVIAKRFSGVGYVEVDPGTGIIAIPEPRVYALGGIGFLALLMGGRRFLHRRKVKADGPDQVAA